jgi:HPt (histidine-containing phosphotransfer) domain-containing protein
MSIQAVLCPAWSLFMESREPQTLDKVELLDRLGGDSALFEELAVLFLEDYPRLLESLRTALAERNPQAVEYTAHALKGSVGAFCARPAFEAAFRLEKIGRGGNLDFAGEACTRLEDELERFRAELCALAAEIAAR